MLFYDTNTFSRDRSALSGKTSPISLGVTVVKKKCCQASLVNLKKLDRVSTYHRNEHKNLSSCHIMIIRPKSVGNQRALLPSEQRVPKHKQSQE